MKKIFVLLAVFAAVGIFAGAGAFAAPADKVLTIGVDQEAVGLDPHIVTAFSSMRRIDLMYNRLVRLDDSFAVVPDLASSWDIPNNTTYVFHLRKGVKFHNG
ncbi:MAG TPA: ABC transporter substrate-binding protein, partial [bacterium]|nr:ABC transporter substrate-binding protein [bacterium]